MLIGLIAHQGGWDEALLIAVPMLFVAGLLWLAKRRVNRAEHDATARSGHAERPDSVASADQHGPTGP